MSIGENIKKARKAAGMKRKELARLMYVSTETMGNYERGKTLPSVTMLKPLAKALGCSVEALLEEDRNERDFENEN